MRVLLLVLCLVICFLFGALYGVKQERVVESPSQEEIIEETVEEVVTVDLPVGNMKEVAVMPSGDTPAYKAASALEMIVDFFYNIVVEVLYQVSRLFY